MIYGFATSGDDFDFFCYNAAGLIWNGAAFVAWNAANFASYRVEATENAGSGKFLATEPAGTILYELRPRGATLALSQTVWAGDTRLDAIYAKTELITPSGITYVSSADVGMLNVREAYVVAFDHTNGELKTGDAANITARWKKDDGNAEPLDDTTPVEVRNGVYMFSLTDAERTFSRVAYILPESSTENIVVRGDPPVYHMIDSLILAKARLIGTAEAALRSPMLESGGFAEPLVIGDDYLESLSRSIEWTVTSAVAPTSGKIGFRREGKSRSTSDKFTLSADSEQIEDLGSNRYRIYFDMPRSTTLGKTPDNYEYQLSLFDGSGNKITFYHSHFFAADGTPARNYVTLVESYIEES